MIFHIHNGSVLVPCESKNQVQPIGGVLLDSPLGEMWAEWTHQGLTQLRFLGTDESWPEPFGEPALGVELRRQLQAFFQKDLREFDIALAPIGTPFQLAVWEKLLRIPFGATFTYSELAEQLGDPLALRAVGGANGANPIPILIPCHRVVRKGGNLGGYSGELWRKKYLLELEGALPQGSLWDEPEDRR